MSLLLEAVNDWYLANAGPVQYSLCAEHAARLLYAMSLILVFGLIDLTDACAKYKIRPRNRPTAGTILWNIGVTAKNMLLFHMVPLLAIELYTHGGRFAPAESAVAHAAPTFAGLLVAPLIYLLAFDVIGYIGHYFSHRPRMCRLTKWLTDEHHAHHKHTITEVHAWNGYVGSTVECLGGLVFFQTAMWPLAWFGLNDPLTRAWAIAVFQWHANMSHSGYDFPFEPQNVLPYGDLIWHGSVGHWYHHSKRNKNMAIFFAYLDILFGTHFDHMNSPTPKERIWLKMHREATAPAPTALRPRAQSVSDEMAPKFT